LVKYVSTGSGQVYIMDVSLPKTGTNYYIVHTIKNLKLLISAQLLQIFLLHLNLDNISNEANLNAEIPVLNGKAPPPLRVRGFSHS
jgi:hypothetical protein